MSASLHIFHLSEALPNSISESHVINAFKEFQKTGKPVTIPIKQQNFYDHLRMAWCAYRGVTIYEFLTISKEVDRQNLEIFLGPNQLTGNWH